VDDKMVFAKEDVEAIAQVMELAPGNIWKGIKGYKPLIK
jgi:hypothetical protein